MWPAPPRLAVDALAVAAEMGVRSCTWRGDGLAVNELRVEGAGFDSRCVLHGWRRTAGLPPRVLRVCGELFRLRRLSARSLEVHCTE